VTTDVVLVTDDERRRRRAELVVAYANAENAEESARICAEISRLDEGVRAARARPRIPTEHRTPALRALGPDRKTVAAGERD
jgi:hypothetical protein